MTQDAHILVVDDEPLNLDIMQEYLAELYPHIRYAKDGLECLEQLKQQIPDVILLDVSMPKLNGYEVCKQIRATPEYENIAIVFVSARGTAEERMLGFKAGGDDYIVKPFEEAELLNKLEKILGYKHSLLDLKEQLSSMQNVAFDAMLGNAEMGYVIQYLTALFNSESIQQLVNATMDLHRTLGLHCCLQIKHNQQYQYFSDRGQVSPLENEIIQLLSNQGRIYRFDNRCQFNFPQINLLIKNMPIDDEVKYGRIIDLLPIAMEGANSFLIGLGLRKSEAEKQQVKAKIAEIEAIAENISTTLQAVHQASNQALDKLSHTLEDSLPFMALEDDQEALLSDNIDSVVESVKRSLGALTSIEQHIKQMVDVIAR